MYPNTIAVVICFLRLRRILWSRYTSIKLWIGMICFPDTGRDKYESGQVRFFLGRLWRIWSRCISLKLRIGMIFFLRLRRILWSRYTSLKLWIGMICFPDTIRNQYESGQVRFFLVRLWRIWQDLEQLMTSFFHSGSVVVWFQFFFDKIYNSNRWKIILSIKLWFDFNFSLTRFTTTTRIKKV